MTTKPVKQNTQASEGTYDWGLLTIVATLLALGNVMVFSASYAQGIAGYDNPFFFFMRQLMWMSIGLGAMVVAMRVPYHYWQRWSVPLMGVSLLALMGVIAFGTETSGSTRTCFGGSVHASSARMLAGPARRSRAMMPLFRPGRCVYEGASFVIAGRGL